MSREPVKSAVRALEILKLFSEERRELNQREIIGRLRYPQSSATFLLKSMVNTGFLTFDRTRRTYLPTPEVYRVGEWLENLGYEHIFREGVLTALLDELRAKTGGTVSLTTQNDICVQWHRIVGNDLPPSQRVTEGTSLPLTWSAYGRVLLSRQSDSQIDRVVRLINAREPDPAYKFNVTQTAAMIREVRLSSIFYMINQRLSGAAAFATILPVRIGGRNVAIGVGGDSGTIEPRRDAIMRSLSDTLAAYKAELVSTFCEERHLAIAA
jgi:DNA-binding IclR family transcriptional regulator